MEDFILAPAPIPGALLLADGKREEGAIIAFRKGGDEVLFASCGEDRKGLMWIPIIAFSVDPDAVTPIEIEEQEEIPEGPIEVEQPPGKTPFGVRRRPEA